MRDLHVLLLHYGQYFVPLCSAKMQLLALGEEHMEHIACRGTELTLFQEISSQVARKVGWVHAGKIQSSSEDAVFPSSCQWSTKIEIELCQNSTQQGFLLSEIGFHSAFMTYDY